MALLACRLCASVLVLLVMVWDVRTRRIPNALPLAIAATALAGAAIAGNLPGLWEACLVFGCGLCLFALNVMGGGDVKTLTAAALLLPGKLVPLLFVTALAGGMLALVALAARVLCRKSDRTVPYGVAIGTGVLYCLWF